jgi:hypothetical protein
MMMMMSFWGSTSLVTAFSKAGFTEQLAGLVMQAVTDP